MARKQNDTAAYDTLLEALSGGTVKNLYIFHGEEQYLLTRTLERLRAALVEGDFAEFNYKRIEARGFTVDELVSAVEALPVFAERSLVEVRDVDIFKCAEPARNELRELLSDLPEYVCLVFVYDTVAFAPDKRQKLYDTARKNGYIVEFAVQDQSRLVKWIKAHFRNAGKTIDTHTAEHLAFVTGGLMATLNTEIEKLSSLVAGDTITRADIDDAVTPTVDAVAYRLADSLAAREYAKASAILEDLLTCGEAPHKLIYTITMKMRQLLLARVCIDSGISESKFAELAGIRHSFIASGMMRSARITSTGFCRSAVLICTETAYSFNSGVNPEDGLRELVLRLAAAETRVR